MSREPSPASTLEPATDLDRATGPGPACTLPPAGARDRRQRWIDLSSEAVSDPTPTADGVRLCFRLGPDTERELRALAALERECCSFARWVVRRRPRVLVLEVSARDAAGIAAVRSLFDLAPQPEGSRPSPPATAL